MPESETEVRKAVIHELVVPEGGVLELNRLTGLRELVADEIGLTTGDVISRARELSQLTLLSMEFNELSAVPVWTLDMVSLRHLFLADNGLRELPAAIGGLTELRLLDLANNALSELPESIVGLTNLVKLNVSQNGLTALPEGIGNLTGLVELGCHGNLLSSLPPSFSSLASLTELQLFNNNLASLDESLFIGLRSLEQIKLTQNALSSLPQSLSNLSGTLELFEIMHNSLTVLPECFTALTALNRLYLSENQLSELPSSLGNLQNLTALHIHENALSTIPVSLAALTNLPQTFDWGYLGGGLTLSPGNFIGNIPQQYPSWVQPPEWSNLVALAANVLVNTVQFERVEGILPQELLELLRSATKCDHCGRLAVDPMVRGIVPVAVAAQLLPGLRVVCRACQRAHPNLFIPAAGGV